MTRSNRFFELFKSYHNIASEISLFKKSKKHDIIVKKCSSTREKDDSKNTNNKYRFSFSTNRNSETKEEITEIAVSYYLIEEINKKYYEIFTNLDSCIIEEWFVLVREFIEFLDIAEDMCLYVNDTESPESDTYIDIDKNSSSYVMYITDHEKYITYRISFIDTQIEKPGSNSTIMKFLEGSDCNYVENNITLIQFDIMRSHGTQKHTEFKFMSGSDHNLVINTEENIMVFTCMRNYITKIMFKTLNDIFYNTNLLFGIENSVDEVLYGNIELPN